jgi:hypothetical protein
LLVKLRFFINYLFPQHLAANRRTTHQPDLLLIGSGFPVEVLET